MSKQIRFCPQCGSTWVEPDTSNRAEIAFTGGNPNKWSCNECGYTGIMPEGDPEDDFEPDSGEKPEPEFDSDDIYPREDLSFGKGYFNYILYVTGLIAIALAAYFLYRLLISG